MAANAEASAVVWSATSRCHERAANASTPYHAASPNAIGADHATARGANSACTQNSSQNPLACSSRISAAGSRHTHAGGAA